MSRSAATRSRSIPLALFALAVGLGAAGSGAAAAGPATAAAAGAQQPVDVDALDAHVDALREAWRIPGLALAIVRHDSVVLARGYGAREVGSPEPVDAATLFAIGSTTKAFTAAAIAMLIAEGKLDWDDPVADRLPGFALADPWVTRAITIRDLLAHRSGLPMANLMWLSGLHDSDELIRRLRLLDADAGFRATFAYQNVLYLAAGRIVEEAAGVPWADFVADQMLRPLGMARTLTGVGRSEGDSNRASPHAAVDGMVRTVPYRNVDAVGPAGSILSSAGDLARWLRFQLAGGALEGRRLLAEDALAETHRPQIVLRGDGPLAAFYPDAGTLAYGMGWVVSEYRGRSLLDHGGGIDGMTSLVALMPEERLGVAILTNLQTAAPPYWILYPLLDRMLGEEPVDREEEFRAIAGAVEAAIGAEPPRIAGTTPSLQLEAYADVYRHPALGESRVALQEGRLAFDHGRFRAPLEHWHLDTFRLDWSDRAWRAAAGPGWITFRAGRDGRIDAFELTTVPGESWTFERRPD